ncbi:MAG: tetratricopeptide repeat protein [Leptospirillia bacterium]
MSVSTHGLIEQADRLYRAGALEASRPLLERVATDHPEGYPDVHNRLGVVHHAAGRMAQAVECFERALEINPGYVEAALNLSIAYNDLGRFEEAEEVFCAAAEQVGDHEASTAEGQLANRHVSLGDDYVQAGRLEDALHEYRRALTLKPGYVDVICKVGVTLRHMDRTDEALRVFARAKDLNPDFPIPYVHTGQIYFKKGFLDMAMDEWQHALALDPTRRDAEAYLATVRRALLQR